MLSRAARKRLEEINDINQGISERLIEDLADYRELLVDPDDEDRRAGARGMAVDAAQVVQTYDDLEVFSSLPGAHPGAALAFLTRLTASELLLADGPGGTADLALGDRELAEAVQAPALEHWMRLTIDGPESVGPLDHRPVDPPPLAASTAEIEEAREDLGSIADVVRRRYPPLLEARRAAGDAPSSHEEDAEATVLATELAASLLRLERDGRSPASYPADVVALAEGLVRSAMVSCTLLAYVPEQYTGERLVALLQPAELEALADAALDAGADDA